MEYLCLSNWLPENTAVNVAADQYFDKTLYELNEGRCKDILFGRFGYATLTPRRWSSPQVRRQVVSVMKIIFDLRWDVDVSQPQHFNSRVKGSIVFEDSQHRTIFLQINLPISTLPRLNWIKSCQSGRIAIDKWLCSFQFFTIIAINWTFRLLRLWNGIYQLWYDAPLNSDLIISWIL